MVKCNTLKEAIVVGQDLSKGDLEGDSYYIIYCRRMDKWYVDTNPLIRSWEEIKAVCVNGVCDLTKN